MRKILVIKQQATVFAVFIANRLMMVLSELTKEYHFVALALSFLSDCFVNIVMPCTK